MCWNMGIEWSKSTGEPDGISRFCEMLCGFCLCHPDDSSPDFPERVASQFRDHPDMITAVDADAAQRIENRVGGVREDLIGNSAISDLLGNIPTPWHLFYLSDQEWREKARDTVLPLIETTMAIDDIGPAIATKVLHIKRPHLIPICDSVVMKRLRGQAANNHDAVMECVDIFRSIGIRNLGIILTAVNHIQQGLPEGDAYKDLSLVRALEACVWFDTMRPSRGIYATLLDRI